MLRLLPIGLVVLTSVVGSVQIQIVTAMDCEMVCKVVDGRGARVPRGLSLQTECMAGTAGARADSLGSAWVRVHEQGCDRCLVVY